MSKNTEELKARVTARKKELEAKIATLKADAIGGKNEAITKLQKRLDDVDETLHDGWDKLTDGVAAKLNTWLKHDRESERPKDPKQSA